MVHHYLAMPQQFVKLVAAKRLAPLFELISVDFVPHFAIAGVLEECWETVIDVVNAEKF